MPCLTGNSPLKSNRPSFTLPKKGTAYGNPFFGVPDCILASPKRRNLSLLARTNETLVLSTKYVQMPAPNDFGAGICGVPDWIRTNDTRRRRPVLYPAELRVHFLHFLKNAIIFYYFSLSICKRLWYTIPKLSKKFSPKPRALRKKGDFCVENGCRGYERRCG